MEYYINNLQRSMLTDMAKRSLHMYTLTHPHDQWNTDILILSYPNGLFIAMCAEETGRNR